MARTTNGRLLEERAIDWGNERRQVGRNARPVRSVTVNLVESPLG